MAKPSPFCLQRRVLLLLHMTCNGCISQLIHLSCLHACRALRKVFQAKLDAGAFEPVRPRTASESNAEIRAMLRTVVQDMVGLRADMAAKGTGGMVQPVVPLSYEQEKAQQPSLEEVIAAGDCDTYTLPHFASACENWSSA